MMNGLKYQIDFDELPFDVAFNLLLREIEAVRTKLGAESTSGKTGLIPTRSIFHAFDATHSSFSCHHSNTAFDDDDDDDDGFLFKPSSTCAYVVR